MLLRWNISKIEASTQIIPFTEYIGREVEIGMIEYLQSDCHVIARRLNGIRGNLQIQHDKSIIGFAHIYTHTESSLDTSLVEERLVPRLYNSFVCSLLCYSWDYSKFRFCRLCTVTYKGKVFPKFSSSSIKHLGKISGYLTLPSLSFWTIAAVLNYIFNEHISAHYLLI